MIVESFLGDAAASAVASAVAHPVLALLIVLGFVSALYERWRGRGPRDPIRCFTRVDKAEILTRAGRRCEHHGWLRGRCSERDRLEADHVHPHSRGGWTNVQNGQALCRRHNKAKRATIPTNGQLRRLAERRAAYYPHDVSPAVVRRRPRARTADNRALSA